jgi:hypothetical protein
VPAEPMVLVCPCCASAVDATASPDIETFLCATCGQVWEMIPDPARQQTYSLS